MREGEKKREGRRIFDVAGADAFSSREFSRLLWFASFGFLPR